MIVKRVAPLPLGKMLCVLYAVMGLVFGLIFSVVGMFSSMFTHSAQPHAIPGFGLMFGVGAVIFLPIFYGVIGFLGGLISAALYNVLARTIGGIVIDVE